ncbi:hypothetical protein [Spirosoma sp. KUDC1026]|uniref:hypothetical protein n=1 Tax=Spirosoma sp. KUDC1026 TaxID=2745947 RepID=UPI001E3A660F|nr:hypothetical protein [Spirosoma sp. KUDC1026]
MLQHGKALSALPVSSRKSRNSLMTCLSGRSSGENFCKNALIQKYLNHAGRAIDTASILLVNEHNLALANRS